MWWFLAAPRVSVPVHTSIGAFHLHICDVDALSSVFCVCIHTQCWVKYILKVLEIQNTLGKCIPFTRLLAFICTFVMLMLCRPCIVMCVYWYTCCPVLCCLWVLVSPQILGYWAVSVSRKPSSALLLTMDKDTSSLYGNLTTYCTETKKLGCSLFLDSLLPRDYWVVLFCYNRTVSCTNS